MKQTLNQKQVKDFYENLEKVWPENDKWHKINQKEINRYVKNICFKSGQKILNAGSGGSDYGLKFEMYHVDIVENKISKFTHHTVGTIEKLPFEDSFFDVIICVGSVLNYCNAIKAIHELSRVLKKKGELILEFESSYSFEYIKTKAYKSSCSIINTEYFGVNHKILVYSPNYISSILLKNKLIIYDKYHYHILSGLFCFFIKDESRAAKYAIFDKILRRIPVLHNYSGNVIFYCIKNV